MIARSLRLGLVLSLAVPGLARAAQDDPDAAWFRARMDAFLVVIEREHAAPPPARELVAAGIASLAQDVDPALASWAERVPTGREERAAFLAELYAAASAHAARDAVSNAFLQGVSRSLPGGARSVDAETARVDDSLEGNRYVGVGVVLEFEGEYPTILDTHYGGPAQRGGIQPGDLIYEVDGHDARGMGVERFIDYSRDEAGTELVYVVGSPGSDERREVRMTRAVVPQETVLGTRRGRDGRWRHGVDGTRVAYVKLVRLSASSAHELRGAAEAIRAEGLAGVLLDLRRCHGARMPPAAQVADLFCGEGLLGASVRQGTRREYHAGPDVLFDARELIVLVDVHTSGPAAWLAAILGRSGATLVGQPTAAQDFLFGRVTIPDWSSQVHMATGRILDPRAQDDRALRRVEPDVPAPANVTPETVIARLFEDRPVGR